MRNFINSDGLVATVTDHGDHFRAAGGSWSVPFQDADLAAEFLLENGFWEYDTRGGYAALT